MIKTDIASDIKAILGDKYKIYVDNNANEFINIDKDMTIEKQFDILEDHVTCIFRTQPGEIVALKDLFSSSFGYSLDFYVPVDFNIYEDLDSLISNMNGSLHDNADYRYIITFNSPMAIQGADVTMGRFYSVISLTGSIAHSDKSMYGNEVSFEIDNQYSLKGIINHSISMRKELDVRPVDESLYPLLTTKYILNTLSLTIHARKDDEFIQNVLSYIFDPILLENKRTFDILMKCSAKSYTFANASLTEASEESSLGGYIILSCTFVRTEVI